MWNHLWSMWNLKISGWFLESLIICMIKRRRLLVSRTTYLSWSSTTTKWQTCWLSKTNNKCRSNPLTLHTTTCAHHLPQNLNQEGALHLGFRNLHYLQPNILWRKTFSRVSMLKVLVNTKLKVSKKLIFTYYMDCNIEKCLQQLKIGSHLARTSYSRSNRGWPIHKVRSRL